MIIEFGLLGDLLRLFDQSTAAMLGRIQPYGLSLFYLLTIIDLAWVGTKIALEPAHGVTTHNAIWTVFRWAFRQTVLFSILMSWPAVAPSVIASFRNAATQAGAFPDSSIISPSYFAAQGIGLTSSLFDNMGTLGLLTSPVSGPMTILAAVAIQVSFLFMAATITLALIEVQLGMVAGALLFGFSGSRWTLPLAESVFSYLFRVGIRLFVTYLLAGLISQLLRTSLATIDWTTFLGAFPNVLMLVLSLGVTAILLWTLPRRATDLIPAGSIFKF